MSTGKYLTSLKRTGENEGGEGLFNIFGEEEKGEGLFNSFG